MSNQTHLRLNQVKGMVDPFDLATARQVETMPAFTTAEALFAALLELWATDRGAKR